MNTRECANCGNDVLRLKTEKKRKDGGFIYVDCKNRQWKGSICPDCMSSRHLSATINPKTKRLCLECNRPLPASHRYRHPDCWTRFEAYSGNFEEVYQQTPLSNVRSSGLIKGNR